MRLAQLARKLAVRPAEIADFLEGININVENGSNFRLDDQMVALVMAQFGQVPEPVNATEPDVEPVIQVTDIQVQSSDADVAEPVAVETEPAEAEEGLEVIKAPKVELPGLRVLGKIDLPEPKPKTPEPDNENTQASGTVPARSQAPRRQRTDTSRGTRKNPVTLRREREAREAERKRRAEEELEKERRRQKYLSKVKINVPTKPARIFDEEVEELEQELPVEPAKGVVGRFMKWLVRR